MANAPRDNNRIPVLLATLNSDGSSIQAVYADPSTHELKVSDGTAGSGSANSNAPRDANRVTAVMAVSSSDGVTPVEVWADSSGNLLVQST